MFFGAGIRMGCGTVFECFGSYGVKKNAHVQERHTGHPAGTGRFGLESRTESMVGAVGIELASPIF